MGESAMTLYLVLATGMETRSKQQRSSGAQSMWLFTLRSLDLHRWASGTPQVLSK